MALVEEIAVTSADTNDGWAGSGALPDEPGERLASCACRGANLRQGAVRSADIPYCRDRNVRGGRRTKAGPPAVGNACIHRVRAQIEKTFGTWKDNHGPRKIRRLGFANAKVEDHLIAIALDLKRTLSMIAKTARSTAGSLATPPHNITEHSNHRSCQNGAF
jgi:IS5 family transposase